MFKIIELFLRDEIGLNFRIIKKYWIVKAGIRFVDGSRTYRYLLIAWVAQINKISIILKKTYTQPQNSLRFTISEAFAQF